MKLNYDVLDNILSYTDKSTQLALSRSSMGLHQIALRHLYRSIELSRPFQLVRLHNSLVLHPHLRPLVHHLLLKDNLISLSFHEPYVYGDTVLVDILSRLVIPLPALLSLHVQGQFVWNLALADPYFVWAVNNILRRPGGQVVCCGRDVQLLDIPVGGSGGGGVESGTGTVMRIQDVVEEHEEQHNNNADDVIVEKKQKQLKLPVSLSLHTSQDTFLNSLGEPSHRGCGNKCTYCTVRQLVLHGASTIDLNREFDQVLSVTSKRCWPQIFSTLYFPTVFITILHFILQAQLASTATKSTFDDLLKAFILFSSYCVWGMSIYIMP